MCACDGMSAFSGLFLSAIVCHCLSPHVCLCWMVCPPSRGLVPPLSPIGSPRWCVRLPKVLFPRVVFHCLPSPFLFPFLGWCARLLGVLSPLVSIVSHSLPSSPHMCAFVGWCVRLPEVLSPIVSHCVLTWCVPDFPTSCLQIVSHCPRMCACVGWCVRLPEVLSPPIVSPRVCLCWMLCPPSRGLVSFCLPLSPHMCACVGWCVRLPEVLSPCCLPLSPFLFPCVGKVCPPSWGFVSLVP